MFINNVLRLKTNISITKRQVADNYHVTYKSNLYYAFSCKIQVI